MSLEATFDRINQILDLNLNQVMKLELLRKKLI